jgi:hypothetical protein
MITARVNGAMLMFGGILFALIPIDRHGSVFGALVAFMLAFGSGYALFTVPRRNPMPAELVAFVEEERASKASRAK